MDITSPQSVQGGVSHRCQVLWCVAANRRAPILTTDLGRKCLNEAIHDVRDELPFENVAFVLLPDHLHTV